MGPTDSSSFVACGQETTGQARSGLGRPLETRASTAEMPCATVGTDAGGPPRRRCDTIGPRAPPPPLLAETETVRRGPHGQIHLGRQLDWHCHQTSQSRLAPIPEQFLGVCEIHERGRVARFVGTADADRNSPRPAPARIVHAPVPRPRRVPANRRPIAEASSGPIIVIPKSRRCPSRLRTTRHVSARRVRGQWLKPSTPVCLALRSSTDRCRDGAGLRDSR